MKNFAKLVAGLVAVVGIFRIGFVDRAWATEEITETPPTAQHAVSDYLLVQEDGTLALRASALPMIPADQRDAASQSLDDLNHRIQIGAERPFTVDDSRLKMPIGDNGAQPMGNCFCGDGCCSQHMCCKSGWWLLCWGYGSC